jgi:hypothetical protein
METQLENGSVESALDLDQEVEDVDESDDAARSVEPVSYFGTEFDVHGLVRRFNSKAIVVPTFDPSGDLPDKRAQGFQRRGVWRPAQKQRFIESLLLGFPVPGIFLVEQPGKKYLVLDGQQRLNALVDFYAGKFKLDADKVDDRFADATYESLTEDLARSLDDTFIQSIIIRTPSSLNEYESVYQIFERLNSGGTNLQPHEIRVAIYGGTTVEAIRTLNEDKNWRNIFGSRHARLKDQELILRVIAMYVDSSYYKAPLKTFLNDFLYNHRNAGGLDLNALSALFVSAAKIIAENFGERPLRLGYQINAAILESVFVGVMQRIDAGGSATIAGASWKSAYDALLKNQDYLAVVSKATANEEPVKQRLLLAGKEFAVL